MFSGIISVDLSDVISLFILFLMFGYVGGYFFYRTLMANAIIFQIMHKDSAS
jgi:uncharacterized protein YneF (UPF0154 family)